MTTHWTSTIPNVDERQRYLRSIRSIVVRVGVVCAALVVVGATLAALYVWWQTTPGQLSEASSPDDLRISFDPVKLSLAGVAVAVLATASGAVAAWFIARSAIRPLEQAAEVQRRFVADASHELRTPLAVMSARAQQLSALLPSDGRTRVVADELREDVRIMSTIVDDMLEAARGTAHPTGDTPLSPALTHVAADLALLAAEREVRIVLTDHTSEAVVAVPSARLHRMLTALVDNAIVHSPQGGAVELIALIHGSSATVTVADHGTGISGITPERVFDRFAHGSAPADARRTASGIGLALVREVAESHDGFVRVVATGPGGTVMELGLPLSPESRA